jgi:SAM-dependent MidA family methyltransferase
MRVANTAYYGRADPLGADGDFITAPEISQMFGEMVGIWLSDIWLRRGRPSPCYYVELGPGRGTLAADALRTMKRFGFEPEVHFIENSPALREKQLAAVPLAMFHDDVETVPTDAPLFIVANEFFDALPIAQMIATNAGWHERVVVADHSPRFAAMPGPRSTRLSGQGGVMLTIDYGYLEPALGSTLQAVQNHTYADPFSDPGHCDLTAHVDFHALSLCAQRSGLDVAGPCDQGAWLSGLGIDQRAMILAQANPDRATEISDARSRLVARESMGALFKVMATYAKDWPEPEGFAR